MKTSTHLKSRRPSGSLGSAGFTLVELMIAVTIMSVMAASLISVRSFMAKQTLRIKDKAFAAQKALQIMEELRSVVNGKETSILTLDNFNNGDPSVGDPTGHINQVLTTDTTITDPGNPLSGNLSFAGAWKYARNVEVAPDPSGNPYGRFVKVRIYYNGDVSHSGTPRPIVEIASLLRTSTSPNVPTQVYDVYALAIANVPGWWSVVSQLHGLFDGIVKDLESRNPGFIARVHYITRTSYGRDQEYAPFINSVNNASVSASPYLYLYPGVVYSDGGTLISYLDYTTLLNGDQNAQISTDTGTGASPQIKNQIQYNSNPQSPYLSTFPNYVLADYQNNAVRYPDEVRMYNAACSMAAAQGVSTPEPSLRLLLDRMADPATSAQYQNILILSLHGELMPMPPIRDYSDAAKQPDLVQSPPSNQAFPALVDRSITYNNPVSLRYMRLVTHPEQLEYPAVPASAAAMDVTLRVYPYIAPLNNATTVACPVTTTLPVASLYLPNDNLPDTAIDITKIEGFGKDSTFAGSTYDAFAAQKNIHFTVTHPNGNDTLITLYNTPMRNTQNW